MGLDVFKQAPKHYVGDCRSQSRSNMGLVGFKHSPTKHKLGHFDTQKTYEKKTDENPSCNKNEELIDLEAKYEALLKINIDNAEKALNNLEAKYEALIKINSDNAAKALNNLEEKMRTPNIDYLNSDYYSAFCAKIPQ